ncbi:MAG: hypothetical protein U0X39_13565 [Bacteroidales bacterium]
MIKKILFGIIAVAVLSAAYIGFTKTAYWNRSIRIFRMDKQDQFFNGREGRGQFGGDRPGFTGREEAFRREGAGNRQFNQDGQFREEGRRRQDNLPDSVHRQFGGMRRPGMESGRIDSLRRQFARGDSRSAGQRFPATFMEGDRRGRGEFPGSRKIRLSSVLWFLAVFSGFTVVAIYTDKAICLIARKKK